jgi:hypothetical protein
MAISVVENLVQHGGIDQDSLAAAFSKRYLAEPYRGYSSQTGGLLTEVVSGMDWRTAVFLNHPSGSYGNGPASAHYCHRPVIRSE